MGSITHAHVDGRLAGAAARMSPRRWLASRIEQPSSLAHATTTP